MSLAIFLARLVASSSSLKSPSSSVPSGRIRYRRVDVLYDFRLLTRRSEKSTSLASTVAGMNLDRAWFIRRRDREMPVPSSSSSSYSLSEGDRAVVGYEVGLVEPG